MPKQHFNYENEIMKYQISYLTQIQYTWLHKCRVFLLVKIEKLSE